MGQAAIPIMIGMTAVSGGMQYRQQKAAGVAADNEAKRAAQQEESQLREEQIERRERLIQSLSAQNASVGASGALLGGSSLNIMETDQEQFEQEDLRARLSGQSKVSSIREAGKTRKKMYNTAAKISLVDSAATAAGYADGGFSAPKKTGTK